MVYLRLKGTCLLFRVTDLSVGEEHRIMLYESPVRSSITKHGGLSGVCRIEWDLHCYVRMGAACVMTHHSIIDREAAPSECLPHVLDV